MEIWKDLFQLGVQVSGWENAPAALIFLALGGVSLGYSAWRRFKNKSGPIKLTPDAVIIVGGIGTAIFAVVAAFGLVWQHREQKALIATTGVQAAKSPTDSSQLIGQQNSPSIVNNFNIGKEEQNSNRPWLVIKPVAFAIDRAARRSGMIWFEISNLDKQPALEVNVYISPPSYDLDREMAIKGFAKIDQINFDLRPSRTVFIGSPYRDNEIISLTLPQPSIQSESIEVWGTVRYRLKSGGEFHYTPFAWEIFWSGGVVYSIAHESIYDSPNVTAPSPN